MMMRRLLILLGMVLAASAFGCTVTKTPAEHAHAYNRQGDIEAREVVEDIDTFWLADRPSRLTRWHVR
jgi:hypothetical protein